MIGSSRDQLVRMFAWLPFELSAVQLHSAGTDGMAGQPSTIMQSPGYEAPALQMSVSILPYSSRTLLIALWACRQTLVMPQVFAQLLHHDRHKVHALQA